LTLRCFVQWKYLRPRISSGPSMPFFRYLVEECL